MIPDTRCARCPVPAQSRCWGPNARHLCDHIDPGHPTYRPEFGPAIVEMSRNIFGGGDSPGGRPSAGAMAASLARSFWDWAVSGFSAAPHEAQRERLNACIACPEWDSGARRCRICGCFTDVKVRLRTERCPIGKW